MTTLSELTRSPLLQDATTKHDGLDAYNTTSTEQPSSLRDCVINTMENYFQQIDVRTVTGVYEIFRSVVEKALLEVTMKYTRNNQSKAAEVLGLSRGTLRKKLAIYLYGPMLDSNNPIAQSTLGEHVANTMNSYYTQVGIENATNVYDMLMAEVEGPALDKLMKYTIGNQSLGAIVLGLSRGTIRKKLKQYGLID